MLNPRTADADCAGMRPRTTINAFTYGILCFAGAGSYIMPNDLTMPMAMAETSLPSATEPLGGTTPDAALPLDVQDPSRATGRDR